MPGNLSLQELTNAVEAGEIDTVIPCQVDMQGRLMGKRLHASYFLDSAVDEVHSCNYLLATDMEMSTIQGYASSSWSEGYGDYTMKPDLTTLRRIPWLEKTALVIADVLDHHGHAEVTHSPRAMLKMQVARLEANGFEAKVATELECHLFNQSYEEAHAGGYRNLDLISPYNEDYHIFQTTKEENVMRAIRNGLHGAGIPVEGTKGEADVGQEEINVKYSDALDAADNHAITKNAAKEIAWANGRSLTFLAKWSHDAAGNSSHIHQSLWTKDGEPAFFDPDGKYGMSALMRHYLAGLLKYSSETAYFLAPHINSYKRFARGTFAPTRIVWSRDNRTAGYRLCGDGTKSIRVECRFGGSDLNPHLAIAAQIAAGLAGIEEKLELDNQFTGDAYDAEDQSRIHANLRDAADAMRGSDMLRAAFGDEVIDHYCRAADWEQEEFERKVTDWEVARGFERA